MSVYFITCRGMGIVKIGCATNVESRLSSLQTASPADLRLEAVLDGYQDEERELHIRFAEHRVRGEWFSITEEIEAVIRSARISSVAGKKPIIRRRQKTDEELAEESIRRERKAFAECMVWRERHDPTHGLSLPMPEPQEKAA